MDDEDELRALRASKKYNRGRQETPQTSSSGRASNLEAVAVDEEKQREREKKLEEIRKLFPTSFGGAVAKVDHNKLQEDALSKAKRKAPTPGPGPEGVSIKKQQTHQEPVSSSVASSSSSSGAAGSNGGKEEKENEPEEEGNDSDDDGGDSDSDSESESEDENPFDIPFSHEAQLQGHGRGVGCLALDPSGTRLLTGGMDYMVKFWDFAGMDQSFQSFREVEPFEGHQVKRIRYSNTGDQFLAITGNATAKVYTRDGFTVCQTKRGDMYIRDMKHTTGHVTSLTDGMWHPNQRNIFATSSEDATIRIWDLETPLFGDELKNNQTVIKYKPAVKGAGVTSACYSPNGKMLLGAGSDGGMQIWDTQGSYTRPDKVYKGAHTPGCEITSVDFSRDNWTFFSRATDNTLKVWDVRKPGQCVKSFENLMNSYASLNTVLSPTELVLATTTSVNKETGEGGKLVLIDRKKLTPLMSIDISTDASATSVLWHKKLNQIFVGCSDGSTRILYDPERSKNGALLAVGRRAKPKDTSGIKYLNIVNPHALPMFQQTASRAKEREKARKDPVRSKRPSLPAGVSKAGQLGRSEMQYLLQQIDVEKSNDHLKKGIDPREALLKYAEETKDNVWTGHAYAKTQPVPIFDTSRPEGEEEDEDAKK